MNRFPLKFHPENCIICKEQASLLGYSLLKEKFGYRLYMENTKIARNTKRIGLYTYMITITSLLRNNSTNNIAINKKGRFESF